MNKLNRKELKFKIEDLYFKSLGVNDPRYIAVLDAIKSIMGMDLETIDSKLLNLFIQDFEKHQVSHTDLMEYKDIPEAMSMYSLEKTLIDRDYEASIENAYYLSRVSDGIQILEFLLEFSLKYCENSYRYIWHIIRIQRFLNGKHMLESLNKSISLILSEDFIDSFQVDNRQICWSDYLSLEFDKIDDLLLYYTIYKSDLIRCNVIRKLIASKLSLYLGDGVDQKKNVLNVYDNQLEVGRRWILDYLNNTEDKKINFDIIILLDNVRSCLMLSDSELEKKYLWTYLNNNLCN